MGKPVKKAHSKQEEKQSKISSFFKKGQTPSASTKPSPLFTSTKPNNAGSSNRNYKNEGGKTTEFVQTPFASSKMIGQEKSPNLSANESYKSSTNENGRAPDKPPVSTQNDIYFVSDTQVEDFKSPQKQCESSFNDSDLEIVPGTPIEKQGVSRRKILPPSRSFLSSTSAILSNRPPGLSSQKTKQTSKKHHSNKLETKLKDNTLGKTKANKLTDGKTWDSSNPIMSVVMTEMGIPEAAKSSMGIKSITHQQMSDLVESKKQAAKCKDSDNVKPVPTSLSRETLDNKAVDGDSKAMKTAIEKPCVKNPIRKLDGSCITKLPNKPIPTAKATDTSTKSILSEKPILSDPRKTRKDNKLSSKRRRASDDNNTTNDQPQNKRRTKEHIGDEPEIPLDDVIKARGLRGKLILQNSKGKKAPNILLNKQRDGDEFTKSGGPWLYDDVIEVTTSFSGEKLDPSAENRQKFSWGSKNAKKFTKTRSKPPAVACNMNSESMSVERDAKIVNDSALLDILVELDGGGDKTAKSLKLDTNTSLLSSSNKEYQSNQAKEIKPSFTKTPVQMDQSKPSLQKEDVAMETVDDLEADDALLDIMAELKETLTQQNEFSAKKSSAKKSSAKKHLNRSFPGQDNKLDTSISRQLDFDDSTSTSHKTEFGPKGKRKKLVKCDKKGSVADAVQQNENANQSEAHLSFMEDGAWLAELDDVMEADDVITSPLKQNLSTQQDSAGAGYDPSRCVAPVEAFGRHKVLAIHNTGQDVTLQVQKDGDKNGQMKTIVLQGFWCDTHVRVGDIVHVQGEWHDDTCTVCDNENYLVVNPDLLISGTSVVSGLFCMRKAILNEKFKGVEPRSAVMLNGSIIHMFFQEVLQHGARDVSAMTSLLQQVLRNPQFLQEMYGTEGVSEASVAAEMHKMIPQVQEFIKTYVQDSASPNAFGIPNRPPNLPANEAGVHITRIADIEENVWSPRFGVKGKIDLTVEVRIHGDQRKSGRTTGSDVIEQSRLLPLELKTGRTTFSAEHKGQVTLYSIMSADRRTDAGAGLLLYLRPKAAMKTIPANHVNKRGLLQLRNEMAHFLRSSCERDDVTRGFSNLPAPISNQNACAKCAHLVHCCAYSSSIEKREFSKGAAMKKLVPQTLGHLSPEHLEYFARWIEMMHVELKESNKKPNRPQQLWCSTAYEREKAGEALCAMTLVREKCRELKNSAQQGKFHQCFARVPQLSHSVKLESDLSLVGLNEGDSVVISGENHPFIALTMGQIHSIDRCYVTVTCDRDLRKNTECRDLIYRLDKCDTYNSMATNFSGLARLMANTPVCEKLRDLIIDLRPPQFEVTLSKTAIEKVKVIFKGLNKPQKTAVLKVLMCKDYVLIKGYPGTGKTSTIVALVRVLAALGFSILLTSYTHSAVDNILLKLKKHGEKFLRLGRKERVHKDLQTHTAEHLTRHFTSVQQLTDFYDSQRIVASTCLGTNHVIFSRRTFDICIVDEASQVLQPACLGPLFCSDKFVLVGDPLQLPPVVQSSEARELGMAESLFHRLDATGGTYELNLQYRMNNEIMRLSNALVYDGALKCGSNTVAGSRLCFTNSVKTDSPWIQQCLSTEPGEEVVFIDTDAVQRADGEMTSHHVTSELEMCICVQLCAHLVQAGVSTQDIGVISLYSQQVRLIRQRMTSSRGLCDVEVNTIDQYQGRDKSVIIISFVKSDAEKGQVSGILKDLRRLNVALTRAKHKLIMTGSQATLRHYPPTRKLLDLLKAQQLVQLSKDFVQTT